MMNKITAALLTSIMTTLPLSVSATPFATIAEECQIDSMYSEYVCEGIMDKKDFYDTWYRPTMPFFVTEMESESLPENAWISPDFDPDALETGAEQSSGGSTADTNDDGEVQTSCPPFCN